MENCVYEKVGFVAGTARMRYRAACNFDVVQLDHERFDGIKLIRVDIEGLCMKCKKEIKITSPNSEYMPLKHRLFAERCMTLPPERKLQ